MAYRLRDAPWWVLAIPYGLLFGPLMAFTPTVHNRTWLGTLTVFLLSGSLYGIGMGIWASRRRRTERAGRTPAEMDAVDSLLGGPVPTDPELGDLARRVGEERLAGESPRALGVLLVLILALTVLFAITVEPWTWVDVAVVLVGAVIVWCRRRRLTERVRELAGDGARLGDTSSVGVPSAGGEVPR